MISSVVLLAAEAAAENRLVHHHLDLFRRLVQHVREVAGESHAREGGALGAGVHVPGSVRFVDGGVERLHRRMNHHVGGVFRFQGLVGVGDGGVGVAYHDPRRASVRVVGERLVFVHQSAERGRRRKARRPIRHSGRARPRPRREAVGERQHPAGALAPTVVDDHGADETGNLPRFGVVDGDRPGFVAGAGNGERPRRPCRERRCRCRIAPGHWSFQAHRAPGRTGRRSAAPRAPCVAGRGSRPGRRRSGRSWSGRGCRRRKRSARNRCR